MRAPVRPPLAGQLGFAVRIARRMARSRSLAWSASTVFVVAGFLMAMFITLGTLSLSGDQVAARDLGRFDAAVGFGSVVLPPGDAGFTTDLQGRLADAGVSDAVICLSAVDVQASTAPAGTVTLLEASWLSHPFPDRYVLLSGRWPDRPGEVVVTEPGEVPATVGGTVPVLGGRVTLRAVGTADDRFASTSNLLVAPGTWAELDPTLTDGFPFLGAQPFVLFSGAEPEAVVTAFRATIDEWATSREADAGTLAPEVLTDSLMTRDQLSARPERNWIARSPAGYLVPSLLLPVAAVVLVFGLNDRRLRHRMARLVSLAVRPATAAAGLTLATLAWCRAAAATGTLAGIGIGAGARAAIASVRDHPPGPIGDLAVPVWSLWGLVVVAGVCAGVRLGRRGAPPKLPSDRRAPRPAVERRQPTGAARLARGVRQLLAVAAWCGAVLYATRVDSPADAMILAGVVTVAVLLVVPETLALVLRMLPDTGARRRLARRQLAADRRRAAAALGALTVLLGGSLGYLTLLDTLIRTVDVQSYPDALPGQVLLTGAGSDTFPPSAETVRVVEQAGLLDGRPRSEVRYSFTTAEAGNQTSAHLPGQLGVLLVVDTPADAERLVGHHLDPGQEATLAGGGLLVWADVADQVSGERHRTHLEIRHGDSAVERTAELATATVRVDLVSWRTGTDGVLLRSTAERLRLPLPEHGPLLVAGVSDADAHAVQAAVGLAGLDARAVRIHVPPPPAVPPAALLATAAGLVALVLIAVPAAVRGQVRVLRGYLARLLAVGVPPAWVRHVLLIQHGVIVVAATVLGIVVALLPTGVLAVRISGFVLSVPWGQLAALLAAIFLAVCVAVLRSVRKLRASEGIRPAS